jgi:hypothetical protein
MPFPPGWKLDFPSCGAGELKCLRLGWHFVKLYLDPEFVRLLDENAEVRPRAA